MGFAGQRTISSFTDLYAWQEGHKLALMVYKETNKLPKSEKHNLVDQLQRASVSITSNIAEGFGRQSAKEKVQFLHISLGSVKELQNQLILCRDLDYITNEQFNLMAKQSALTSKLIFGLIKSLKKSH